MAKQARVPYGPENLSPDPSPLPEHWSGPALVDLQLNGYAGFDFNSTPETWTVDAWAGVRQRLLRRGVRIALPTFITDAPDSLVARASRYAELLRDEPELETTFPFLHIEGPFVSPENGPRGAHPKRHCATPHQYPDLPDRIHEASGHRLRLFTLAPELPGALDLIARLAVLGIRVGLGHTNASTDILRAAVDAGAAWSVHLGNGSHQVLPRLDNYVQVQLAEDRLAAGFVADGHHVPFHTLKNFLRAKTLTRSILVTDAMAAADVGPGRFFLGEEEVHVTDDLRVAKPGQPNLAGSALTLDRAILNVSAHCGIPFPDAWSLASMNPAALLGLPPLPDISVSISTSGFLCAD